MCFFSQKAPQLITQVQPAPQRNTSSGLATFAKLTALRSRGAFDTTATTPLGDLGFGKNVAKPTVLGSLGSAYA